MEIRISRRMGLQPFRGASLDFLNQIRRRTGTRVGNQEVDMIGNRSRFEQSSFLIFHNAADVGVKFVADVSSQQRLPVLRGKNQMYEELGE